MAFLGPRRARRRWNWALKVAVLLAHGGPGGLDEGGLQPGRALLQAGGAALAGTLVVAGAEAGPGEEVAGGGEAAHVEADLGEDDLGGELTDAGDGGEERDRFAERAEVALHLRVDGGDGGGERVDLAEVQAEEEAVVRARPAGQGGADRLGARLDPRADERAQPLAGRSRRRRARRARRGPTGP